jgi:hypothetical protein
VPTPFDSNSNGFVRPVLHPARIAPPMHKTTQSRTTGARPNPASASIAQWIHGNLVTKRSAAIANSQILKIYPPHEFNEFEP